MKLLLRRGGDINRISCTPYRFTAIRQAAAIGNLGAVKMLLKRGADPYKGEFTALHDACYNGPFRVCKFLLDKALDVNHRTGSLPGDGLEGIAWPGAMPIHSALAKSGQGSILRLLIQHGADVNATIDDGKTTAPLHLLGSEISVDCSYIDQLSELSVPILARMLLKNGAKVNEKNSNGQDFMDTLHRLHIKNRQLDAT